MKQGRAYTLVIQSGPAASEDESLRSLRALLKAAKRAYGFRCVSVEPTKPQDTPQQTQRGIDES